MRPGEHSGTGAASRTAASRHAALHALSARSLHRLDAPRLSRRGGARWSFFHDPREMIRNSLQRVTVAVTVRYGPLQCITVLVRVHYSAFSGNGHFSIR